MKNFWLALLLLASTSPPVFALPASGEPTGSGPSAGQIPSSSIYYLAPGDQIGISVGGHPELSLSETVRSDGKISYPLLQTIQTAGLTVDQFRDDLARRLSDYIRRPDVNVVVAAYHVENVYVVGNVRSFGVFPFTRGLSVQEALNLAGGVDADADLQHVRIVRKHIPFATLDLADGPARPFLLQKDDMIFVPGRGLELITVVGSVAHPGSSTLRPKERLLDALTAAGVGMQANGSSGAAAATNQDVDLAHITLTRGSQVQVINGAALLAGDLDKNLLLQTGDVIYVPSAARITVVGDVQRPGTQALAPNERLLDACSAAGIPTGQSGTLIANTGGGSPSAAVPDLTHITLTRAGQSRAIDLVAILNGALEGNVLLQAGDVIYVPPAARITVVGDVARPGAQSLSPGEKLLDAATAAGLSTSSDSNPGSGAAAPDLAHVTLTRAARVESVDLGAVLRGDMEHNIPLQPGDVLYVPSASRITVVGAVQRPGTQPLAANERLLDAVTAAGLPNLAGSGGGTTLAASGTGGGDLPDLNHVSLTRGTQVRTIDLEAVLKGVMQDNVTLEPGDVIYIPTQHGAVTVFGEVAKPGTVQLTRGAHLLDVMHAVGDLNAEADLHHVTVRHPDGTTVTIDMEALRRGEDNSQNLALTDGDVITVPINRMQIAVLGAVQRPGIYGYKPGDKVLQAIEMAGITTSAASLSEVSLVRRQKDGQPLQFTINVQDILKKGNFKTDRELAPGDIIYVPDKTQHPNGFGVFSQLLSIASGLKFLLPVL